MPLSLPVVPVVQCWGLSMSIKESPYLGRSGDAGHNLLQMNVFKVKRNRKPNSSLSQEQWEFISPPCEKVQRGLQE